MNTLTGPQIQRMIDDLRRVIASCEPLTSKAKVPQLDTDILRSQLQSIYEQLFFAPQVEELLIVEKTCLAVPEPVVVSQKANPIVEVAPQPVAPTVEAVTPKIAPVTLEKGIVEEKSIPVAEQVSVSQITTPIAEVPPQIVVEPVVQPDVATEEVVAPKISPALVQKAPVEKTSPQDPAPVAKPSPVPVAQPKAEPVKPAPTPQFHPPTPTTRFQQKPISNISAAIGLNDRFLYIRTLFGGNAAELADTVAKLNAMQTFDEAMQYITSHYQWDMEDAITIQFLELVNRRFI